MADLVSQNSVCGVSLFYNSKEWHFRVFLRFCLFPPWHSVFRSADKVASSYWWTCWTTGWLTCTVAHVERWGTWCTAKLMMTTRLPWKTAEVYRPWCVCCERQPTWRSVSFSQVNIQEQEIIYLVCLLYLGLSDRNGVNNFFKIELIFQRTAVDFCTFLTVHTRKWLHVCECACMCVIPRIPSVNFTETNLCLSEKTQRLSMTLKSVHYWLICSLSHHKRAVD